MFPQLLLLERASLTGVFVYPIPIARPSVPPPREPAAEHAGPVDVLHALVGQGLRGLSVLGGVLEGEGLNLLD